MPCLIEPIRRPRRPHALLGIVLGTALLTAACTQVPAPVPVGTPEPPVPAPATSAAPEAPAAAASAPAVRPAKPPSPVQRLLAFHEQLQSLSAPEVARETARLAASAEPGSTLQLAWLLSQGRNPGDLARAAALLDPLARGDGPEAPLARLLQARLAEQRRLEEQLERQVQQQRDLQRRNDQLREQLDALRAIERSLGPRPAASAPRSP
jgi:hypothetical protein